jgi:hypothetical protein
MQKSLKQEFDEDRKWPWRSMGKVAAGALGLWLVYEMWPVSTLRDALGGIDVAQIAQPYRDRPFKGEPFLSWNWVDASRRGDLVASMPKAEAAVDEMIRLAEGRKFLFYPSTTQAFVPTPKGIVFVMKLPWDKYIELAREATGGPTLDLKRYKPSPEVVAMPAEVLMDYVRLGADGFWRFHLGHEGRESRDKRIGWSINDPVAALTLLRKGGS